MKIWSWSKGQWSKEEEKECTENGILLDKVEKGFDPREDRKGLIPDYTTFACNCIVSSDPESKLTGSHGLGHELDNLLLAQVGDSHAIHGNDLVTDR